MVFVSSCTTSLYSLVEEGKHSSKVGIGSNCGLYGSFVGLERVWGLLFDATIRVTRPGRFRTCRPAKHFPGKNDGLLNCEKTAIPNHFEGLKGPGGAKHRQAAISVLVEFALSAEFLKSGVVRRSSRPDATSHELRDVYKKSNCKNNICQHLFDSLSFAYLWICWPMRPETEAERFSLLPVHSRDSSAIVTPLVKDVGILQT